MGHPLLPHIFCIDTGHLRTTPRAWGNPSPSEASPQPTAGRSPAPWGQTHLSTSARWLGLVMAAMYCMMYLLASVLPAPLSPGREGRGWVRARTQGCPPPEGAPRPPPAPTRDDDAGVLGAAFHGLVGGVGQGEEVRWALVELAPAVLLHRRRAVQRQGPVGVHRHHHLPDVGVDVALREPAHRGWLWGYPVPWGRMGLCRGVLCWGVGRCSMGCCGAGCMPRGCCAMGRDGTLCHGAGWCCGAGSHPVGCCAMLWGRMALYGVLCHGAR